MSMITSEPFGTTAAGETVTAYTLQNGRGMVVRVLDYGGTVQGLVVPDRDGRPVDVALGYDDIRGYETGSCWFGALVGRYANRIGNAAFTLNGKTYRLPKNDGENHLHGVLSHRVLSAEPSGGTLLLRYTSPDGEEGFPGTVDLTASYTLTEDDALVLEYRAVTDADTFVNLTNHTYFNLAGRGDVLSHRLRLDASRITEVGAGTLPTGRLLPVEGTALDFSEDVGAGISRLPYRWRPMSFELDGKHYMFERSIATQQTGFWYLAQARASLPDEVGGLLWFGVDDAATSALTPIYACISEVPECFREGNGSMIQYSPTSAFWQVNKVTHFAYLMYDRVAPVILDEVVRHETFCQEVVAAADHMALGLIGEGKRDQALAVLTEASNGLAQRMMTRWQQLENELLVKFMDGNVKVQNPDGSYKLQEAGTQIPASPAHPDFPERWLRGIVKDHGTVLEVK